MKVTYQLGNFIGEFEGKTQVEIVEQICHFAEVFGEDTCGACKSKNVRFITRTAGEEEHVFYEIKCLDCYARCALGTHQTRDMTMYPKRRKVTKEDGKIVVGDVLPNQGWVKYEPNKDKK